MLRPYSATKDNLESSCSVFRVTDNCPCKVPATAGRSLRLQRLASEVLFVPGDAAVDGIDLMLGFGEAVASRG